MKSISIVLGLSLLLTGCRSYDDSLFFDFPVTETDCLPLSESLSPSLVFETDEEVMMGVEIADSLVLALLDASDSSYAIWNLNSGEYYGRYIRKGRGPNEVLSTLPVFQFDGRYADIYDLYTGRLTKFDFIETVRRGFAVVSESTKLESGSLAPYTQVLRVFDDNILAYDSANAIMTDELVGNPRFILFNSDGVKIREYNCFKDVPPVPDRSWAYSTKGLMGVNLCLNEDKRKMAFTMWHMPQINIMDLETGETFGIKIKGKNKFTHRRSDYHFVSVCSDSDRIYSLYFGAPETEFRDDKTPDYLYVFDWSGKMLANYALDARYIRCGIVGEFLYFERFSEKTNSFYYISRDEI